MEKALKKLANDYGISISDFSYVGETDCRNLGMGKLLYFNIEKKDHPKYHSTVGYMEDK